MQVHAHTHIKAPPETMIPGRICAVLFIYISTDGDHVFHASINFFHFSIYVHQKTVTKVVVAWQDVFGRTSFVSSTSD